MTELNVDTNNGQTAKKIENHFHALPCPGLQACPHRPGRAPQSLYDEDEFFRLAGFRADPREQALLEVFRARHRLRWRGRGSIERLWSQRRLEYVTSQDNLRINFSSIDLAVGWMQFSMGLIVVLAAVSGVLTTKQFHSATDVITSVTAFIGGVAWMWLTMERMVVPETVARRLIRADLPQEPK